MRGLFLALLLAAITIPAHAQWRGGAVTFPLMLPSGNGNSIDVGGAPAIYFGANHYSSGLGAYYFNNGSNLGYGFYRSGGDGTFRVAGFNNDIAMWDGDAGDFHILGGAEVGGLSGSSTLKVSAGELAFDKGSASGTAPGAGFLKLGVVCGTNAGTAKIIAYAGTSTTPVTVVDNVGSGVTGC